MLFNLSLTVARRVILPSVVSRSLLTRPISSTPAFDAPTKAAPRTPKASNTKATSKAKAKPSAKTSQKKKKEKKKEVKKPKFTSQELKVPPRTPLSGYTMFLKTQMGNGKLLGKSAAELQNAVKDIATRWNAMSAEERRPYAEQAGADKEKIREEFEKWRANLSPAACREINKRRKAAGKVRLRISIVQGPKRPINGWGRFVLEIKGQNPDLSLKEAIMRAKPLWGEMSEDRKQVYVEAFEADNKVYREERAAWQAQQKL